MDEETELMSTAPRARAARSLALIIALAAGATPASAQDLFSWLWGGGYRSEVSFHPSVQPRQIIVSFGDRKLYWVQGRGQAISYPIAIPREQSRWQGVTAVSSKQVNPPWTPTPEMRRENPKLPAHVAGGHPLNPLGVRALYLGSSLYRIHGTDAPWTIGEAVSKGCIRMYNEDVVDLYNRVPVGTRVTVTWRKYAGG
jgi:lipoprotein-anchoring transpeptidase ErfK/SrfK